MIDHLLSFYTQTISVCLGLAIIVYYIRKECIEDFSKIEGSLGHEWYVIKSHIWANDVKNYVKELTKLIDEESENYALDGSTDPITDVFSDSTNLTMLKNILEEIKHSYEDYEGFDDILTNFSNNNQLFKKWLDYLLFNVIIICFWGLTGIYISSLSIQDARFNTIAWSAFSILLVSFIIILYNTIKYYKEIGEIKTNIRLKKAEYSHVLQGE